MFREICFYALTECKDEYNIYVSNQRWRRWSSPELLYIYLICVNQAVIIDSYIHVILLIHRINTEYNAS